MTETGVKLIESMDREALVTLWKDKFLEPVPRRISLTLLRQILAFEAQSKQLGGLPSGFVNRLRKQSQMSLSRRAKTEPRPGGRLLREWNGTTHVVDIADGHYMWKEQSYRSLSAIARAITGAHWSGPRFFGL